MFDGIKILFPFYLASRPYWRTEGVIVKCCIGFPDWLTK